MKRIKKPLRWGCEGWRPIVGVMSKTNGKQAPPLSFAVTPMVARDARHSHPSPYRKKSRFAKKSRLRRKKTRLPLTVGHRVYRVYQGCYILTGWFHAATEPLRGSFLWLLSYTFSPPFAKGGGGIGGIRVRLAPLGWRCALSRHLFCLFRGGKES